MAKSHSIAQAKYDSTHCKYYTLKLNLATDSDVIEQLEKVESKQGYIKQLIREDIRTFSVPVSSVPKKSMSIDKLYEFLQGYADKNCDSMYDLLNTLTGKLMGYTPDD